MKKIISTLAVAFCFVTNSNAQIMDSTLTKRPGHDKEMQDTTHSSKKSNPTKSQRNRTDANDSTMNGTMPSKKKSNSSNPSTGKPQ